VVLRDGFRGLGELVTAPDCDEGDAVATVPGVGDE
jgi:hypothetical protein